MRIWAGRFDHRFQKKLILMIDLDPKNPHEERGPAPRSLNVFRRLPSRSRFSLFMNDLTLLLNRGASAGLPASGLLPLVYEELRRLAAQRMAGEAAGHTLQATALVHEAWLRRGGEKSHWESRSHFFGAAAEAMRRILVDHARSGQAARRGGGWQRVELNHQEEAAGTVDDREIIEVHEALDEFEALHPQKAALVKLRYFVGLTNDEAAEVLGISVPTATRHWAFARVWLYRKINRRGDG